MMPGVVAGFPQAAGPTGIVLTSVDLGGEWGFFKGPGGSIVPGFANVNPSAPAVEGAPGELIGITWWTPDPPDPGYPARVDVTVLGNFSTAAQVPFSRLTIDGVVILNKADIVEFYTWGSECMLRWLSPSNPIPVGSHTLVFT